MGSMADAVNAQESKPEAVETSSHGGASVGENTPGQVALPASAPPANPKSPTELKDDQVEDEGDLGVQEPPEKKARKSLEEEMGELMKRTREGFDLTAAALDKVQQHLDISRQSSKDIAQLAQEVHCEKVGTKYQLAQLQQVLSSFQNLEWQVGGTKAESHTSIKAIANKTLANVTASKEELKSIHTELREGIEKLIKAINDGLGTLAAAFTATSLPGNELAGSGFPPAQPPAPPPAAPPVAPSVTAMYGMPGYASSYAATLPSAPQTPALVQTPPMGSTSTVPPAQTVGSAAMSDQPPRRWVLMVTDESGAPRRAAVSPTRHAPGSKLPGVYLNEFGLGCIAHAGGFHRRLPDVFLPKGV